MYTWRIYCSLIAVQVWSDLEWKLHRYLYKCLNSMRRTLRCHNYNKVLIALSLDWNSWEICHLIKSFMGCECNSHITADEKCQWRSYRLCCSWVNSLILAKLLNVTNTFKISKLLEIAEIATWRLLVLFVTWRPTGPSSNKQYKKTECAKLYIPE